MNSSDNGLADRITAIAAESRLEAVGLAAYDYQTGRAWHDGADRWFHAASTIKIGVLVALAAAMDEGRIRADSRLHVRNRFLSTVDGEPFRVLASRDADPSVQAQVGRTMRIGDLAARMIAGSSNLATNLLLDFVGIDAARQTVARLGLTGIDLRRGVEDEKAFDAGVNNRVTAAGLVELLRAIHEGRAASDQRTRWMLDLLLQQEFTSGIPGGLPEEVRASVRVAHKTGEISNMAHDAGLVFLPDSRPYVVAILTETKKDASPRQETVARLSRVVYDEVMTGREQFAASNDA